MSAYKFPFIGHPCKGLWYYEWQIGPIVLMWLHDNEHKPTSERGPRVGKFYCWLDTVWYQEFKIRK